MHEAEIKCREEKVTMSSGPGWKGHYAHDIAQRLYRAWYIEQYPFILKKSKQQ